jgi:hypothetical protein
LLADVAHKLALIAQINWRETTFTKMDDKQGNGPHLPQPQDWTLTPRKNSDRNLLRQKSNNQSRTSTSQMNDPECDQALHLFEIKFKDQFGPTHRPSDVLDILNRLGSFGTWRSRPPIWNCFCLCYPKLFKEYLEFRNQTNVLLEMVHLTKRLDCLTEPISTLRTLSQTYSISSYALQRLALGPDDYDDWIERIALIEGQADLARMSLQRFLELLQDDQSASEVAEELILTLQNYQAFLETDLKANIAEAKNEMHQERQIQQHQASGKVSRSDVESLAVHQPLPDPPGIIARLAMRSGLQKLWEGFGVFGYRWLLVSLLASRFFIIAITVVFLAASLITHAFGVKNYYSEQQSDAQTNSTPKANDKSNIPNYDSNFYTSLSQTVMTILSNYTAIIPVMYEKSTYGIHRRPPISYPNVWWTIVAISTISAIIASAVYPYEGKSSLILSWTPAALAILAALQTIWSQISNNKQLHKENKQLVNEVEYLEEYINRN